jgi:hypothetical protein
VQLAAIALIDNAQGNAQACLPIQPHQPPRLQQLWLPEANPIAANDHVLGCLEVCPP